MISQIYAFTAGTYQHHGLYDEADRWARRALAFGEKHNILYAQAAGYEYLGENKVHAGNFEAGLEYAQREIEIADRLHSRERRAWIHLYSAQCRRFLGQLKEAEQEFLDGIKLAESIGENRALSLLRPNLAVTQAMQGRYDEALQTATTNLQSSSPNLIYTHFEALRCLAEVRFRQNEFDEAERICREAEEFIAPTESRVSRLWLGPLHMEVLLALNKREEAARKLVDYQALVAECQTPRFTAEASRLAALV